MQVKSKEIQSTLELLEQSIDDAKEVEQEFKNLFIVNYSDKQVKYKTNLSKKEFIKALKNEKHTR